MESTMSKVRIEMHLTSRETEVLDKIAEQQGRSRKNLCETELRKIIQSFIQSFLEEEKKKKLLFQGELLLARTPSATDFLNKVMD